MNKQYEKIAYFKKNPAFKRIFEAMLKQWKSYGRCAGTIRLSKATEGEKEALSSITGKMYYGKDLSFKFKDFEDSLQSTIFSGIQMIEVLEIYFDKEITTNKEISRIESEKIVELFKLLEIAILKSLTDATQALAYINYIQTSKCSAYSLLVREYKKDQEKAITMLVNAWVAVERISDKHRIRLAVLATDVSGYPHYFDRDKIEGKCFLYVLSYIQEVEFPKKAEDIANLYYSFHILPDDVSNFTTVYGVHLYNEIGVHKAYEVFIEQKEPYLVSLSNLSTIIRADSTYKHVFIVENQMLFSQLCEEVGDYDVSIVCTSGQMKLASLVLIDLLCQSNCHLYYAGDYDPEGILIADRLIARNPTLIHPWFYEIDNYEKAISKECLSEERCKQLHHIKDDKLQLLVDRLLNKRCAGYQEVLLADMIDEIKKIASELMASHKKG